VPNVAGPNAASGYFSQLYVNGERRNRPRLPRGNGWYRVAAEMAPSEAAQNKGHDRFRFHAGNLRADWANRGDVEVLTTHIWTMSRMRIADVDEAARVVRFTGPTIGLPYYAAFQQNNRYLVENVKEALGQAPGEWYLDRPTGTLTYIPQAGETLAKTTFVAAASAAPRHLSGRRGWAHLGRARSPAWPDVRSCGLEYTAPGRQFLAGRGASGRRRDAGWGARLRDRGLHDYQRGQPRPRTRDRGRNAAGSSGAN
jgi:hypothetical protein